MKQERLTYLEGLRGLCAIMVVLCHFLYAFYYSVFDLQITSSHLLGGLDCLIGASPLNFFFNGKMAVRFFFIICGFVASIKYVKTKDKKHVAQSAFKRYFRLAIPITIINVSICIVMLLGLYANQPAAVISGSMDWFYPFHDYVPTIKTALIEGVYGSVFLGANGYNGVLWVMKYEFWGVMLVYLCLVLFGNMKYRYVPYAVIFAALALIDRENLGYATVFAGMIISDVYYIQKDKMKFFESKHLILVPVFVFGMYLCSFPAKGSGLSGIYGIMQYPPVIMFYAAGSILVFFVLLYSDILQKIMNCTILQKIGKISFALYLIHFPVISTVSSWILIFFNEKMNYNILMIIDFVVTVVVMGIVATFVTKYIEPLGEKVAGLFMTCINKIWRRN